MKRMSFVSIILLIFVVSTLSAVSFVPFMETEQGTIAVLHHTYRNGPDADTAPLFDFRAQGGQDRLYPFSRYSVGATIAGRHRAWLTYQPFELVTNVSLQGDIYVGTPDGSATFTEETPVEVTYSFPFYRFSYTYDILGKHENAILGLGMVLQIRNVSIQLKALDDSQGLFVTNNVGLVPALALYSEYRFPFGLTLGADIAGSYANSEFFNGADFKFEGSILDASLRMGYQVADQWELFGVARFFGGTADGVSENIGNTWTDGEQPYSQNNIATVTATVGVRWSK